MNPSVYRFWNKYNELLYVGKTINPRQRFVQHRDDKPWFDSVTRIEIEHLPTEAEALEAEKRAIKSEQPIHNIVHNRSKGPTPTMQPKREHPLTGMFFHTFTPCSDCARHRFDRQGHIVDVSDGYALIQLFSWLDGQATKIMLIPVDRIASEEWHLYPNNEAMIERGDREHVCPRQDSV